MPQTEITNNHTSHCQKINGDIPLALNYRYQSWGSEFPNSENSRLILSK